MTEIGRLSISICQGQEFPLYSKQDLRGMKKILIVDDDRVTLTMLQMLFTRARHQVLTAQDGAEGLELAQKKKPDIVITDMLIPKMDGLELCKKIKESPELQQTKVIIMTAVYKGIPFKHEARESGASDFIEKPIDTKNLIDRVNVLIGAGQDAKKEETEKSSD
jgi:DNA-binding response OmpR family regulator